MDKSIIDALPIAITEVMPVRNSSGEIIDFEWTAANTQMDRSILPDGGTVVGKRIFEFDETYRGSEIAEATRKAIDDRETQEIITRKGRTAAYFGQTVKTRIIPKGAGCVVYSYEMTEIERQRDAAQSKFELVKTACDHAVHGIILTGEDGNILYANDTFSSMLGYDPQELEGTQIRKVVHPSEFDNDLDIAQKLIAGEIEKDTRDKTYISKDGELLNVSATLSVSWSPDRQAYTYIGHVYDLRDVKKIEEDRDQTRRFLKVLKRACDHAAESIMLIDGHAQIKYANRAVELMSGYSQDELIGMPISSLLDDTESQRDRQLALKLVTGEIESDTRDKEAICKNGDRLKVSVTFSIAPGINPQDTMFVALARDVTEERKMQAELRDALDEAEIATRLKSEFLANMSHEIRTPLNGVLGMSQVLANTGLSPQQAEYLGIIKDSGNNLMVLLNDILDLSKIEAGKLEVSPVEADLRHKLNRVYKIHQPIANGKGLNLRYVVDPSVPAHLSFDPVRVRQCVENLVSNAIKFTSTGHVIMAVKSTPISAGRHKVTVHVSDTGAGVPIEKQAAIFEAFQQGDGSITRSHGGTGLGLAITRQLARLMDGDITMVSDEGRGSVFTLTFEAGVEEGILSDDIPRFEPGDDDVPSGRLSAVRALIVDDNAINRQVASTILKGHGLITDEAENGKVALRKLESAPYDIVLLDIHMPIMDGLQTIREIRGQSAPWADLPVIALTADAMTGDREKYLARGMTGYVSKPIDERDLLSEISRTLNVVDRKQSA